MALLISYSTVQAQYMLKVQKKDGTHDLFWVDYTEAVRWENDYIDAYNKGLFLSIYGRQVGFKNTRAQMYPIDQIEQVTIVGTEPKTPLEEQSTFEVDENTTSVNMVNYSIEFGPSAVEDQKTLTVSRIDNPPTPEGLEGSVNYMEAYDFDMEGVHDLNGVVEIRIPVTRDCFAAYLNEETGEWEPVFSYFDKETNEMVIISDHLSSYAVFDVTNEQTRNAKLVYKGFDPDIDVNIGEISNILTKIADAADATYATLDAFANDAFAKYSLGLSVGVTPIEVGGFDAPLITKYNKMITKMGMIWTVVQFCNSIYRGDKEEKKAAAAKVVFELGLKPALEKKLFGGNLLFPACMTAAAVLDFELNWFATKVHETATTLYANAYDRYFWPNASYPHWGGYGYRNARKWYELLYPLFYDRTSMTDDLYKKIKDLVEDYVTQPWRDIDGFNEALSDCRGWWPFWVEISDKERRKLSDNHAEEIYSGVLKSVIANINNKLLCEAKRKYDEVYTEYATMMNKVVRLKFKDTSVKEGEKSKFAGCKVKFSELPGTIKDPENWECVIKDNGTGMIQFRMYPYCAEKIEPELKVVDSEESLIGYIDVEGIVENGKYFEATFDLANNEVLDMEDSWDISIKPITATIAIPDVSGNYYEWGPLVYSNDKGFEKVAKGQIDGDIYGIFNGIVDLFSDRKLTFDAGGNFSYEKNGLKMSGNFNKEILSGTGTFTLTAMSTGRDLVNEADAFDDWFQEVLKDSGFRTDSVYQKKAWTNLKDFNADFSVSGTLQIYYSALMKRYVITLEGIGSYNFDGYFYSNSDDLYADFDDNGKYVWKYHSKTMKTMEIYVNDGQLIFSPSLVFE